MWFGFQLHVELHICLAIAAGDEGANRHLPPHGSCANMRSMPPSASDQQVCTLPALLLQCGCRWTRSGSGFASGSTRFTTRSPRSRVSAVGS